MPPSRRAWTVRKEVESDRRWEGRTVQPVGVCVVVVVADIFVAHKMDRYILVVRSP